MTVITCSTIVTIIATITCVTRFTHTTIAMMSSVAKSSISSRIRIRNKIRLSIRIRMSITITHTLTITIISMGIVPNITITTIIHMFTLLPPHDRLQRQRGARETRRSRRGGRPPLRPPPATASNTLEMAEADLHWLRNRAKRMLPPSTASRLARPAPHLEVRLYCGRRRR